MAGLIDNGIEAKDMNAVFMYGSIMFLLAIGTLINSFDSKRLSNPVTVGLEIRKVFSISL